MVSYYDSASLDITDTLVHHLPVDDSSNNKTSWHKEDHETAMLFIDNTLDQSVTVSLRGTVGEKDSDMTDADYEGDGTKDISVGANSKIHIRTTYEWNFIDIEASAGTAPTAGTFVIKVKKTGD